MINIFKNGKKKGGNCTFDPLKVELSPRAQAFSEALMESVGQTYESSPHPARNRDISFDDLRIITGILKENRLNVNLTALYFKHLDPRSAPTIDSSPENH